LRGFHLSSFRSDGSDEFFCAITRFGGFFI
jgi:hypothetical protein